ncbi:hypothetical protein [Tessaracoccus caeni]|uniref:hypothetical protein n=1 Tax=Tessaracoccus caeni TaxID=3031239 RepID=UPI0023DC22B8|nr:hypothetical protein [Tessaracoccus caeni]MDF1488877.1 hypothetical protein [Tessaracoccus caeni]
MRRVIVVGVVLALALTGLVARPAAAGDGGFTVSGVGPGEPALNVEKGFYELDFEYSAPEPGGGPLVWVMWKVEHNGDWVPDTLVANAFDEAGTTKRVFYSDGREYWLGVQASDDVEWSATVRPLTEPTTVKTSLSASAKGLSASRLVLLEKGVYSYSASYSGNRGQNVHISVQDRFGSRMHNLVWEDESSSGKETGTFTITERGLVWVDALVGPGTSWKVDAKLVASKKLTATPTPKISGTAQVGKTLTVKPDTWKPSGVKLSYQWLRDGKAIKGATKSTYKLTSSDKGKKISVKVKGSKSGYSSVTKTSSKTKAVKAGKLSSTPTPKISGTAKLGKTLTVKPGTWKPSGVKFSYQWYRNGKKISGATKSTYKISKYNVGKKITVKVKGSKSGYTSVTKTSKATSKVP